MNSLNEVSHGKKDRTTTPAPHSHRAQYEEDETDINLQTKRTVSVSEATRKALTSHADSLKRGKIRVIRAKLPLDFFSKQEFVKADNELMTPSYSNHCNKVDTPSFKRKQPELHSTRLVAASKLAQVEASPLQLQSRDSEQAQQTANFFYFSSSQSTCDVDESSFRGLDSQRIDSFPKKSSKSKAEYMTPEAKIQSESKIATCLTGKVKAQTLAFHREAPETQERVIPNLFGCTFSKDLKYSSAPTSPKSKNDNGSNKIDLFNRFDKEYLFNTTRRNVVMDGPKLVRQRFISRNRPANKQLNNDSKPITNMWKEAVVPNPKGVMLPPLNFK